MGTEIATTQSFQERMFEKIRDQMGDLLADEDLKKIIAVSIEKAFFEPYVDRRGYGSEKMMPGFFVQLVQKELSRRVQDGLTEWLNDNRDRVGVMLRDEIAKGFIGFLHSYVTNLMAGPMQALEGILREKGVIQ